VLTVERLAILLLALDRGGMGLKNVERIYRELSPDERAVYLTRAERELATKEAA